MKIALCLSGQPRNINAGWVNLNHTILQVNSKVDVFIHTWWDDSFAGRKFENAWADTLNQNKELHEQMIPKEMSSVTENDTIEKIQDYYNPKSICIEKPIKEFTDSNYELRSSRTAIDPNKEWSEKYYYNIDSMWNSINKCNDLKRNFEVEGGFLYDVVIRARFDSHLNKQLDFKYNVVKNNTIYVCEKLLIVWYGLIYGSEYTSRDIESMTRYRNYYVNDTFAFGRSDVMDVYSDAGNNFDMLLETSDVPFTPEKMLRKYLEYKEININNLMNVSHELLRDEDGELF
tara:strand:+ start:1464 stop:2327 length:864 start_codon:yes stop_codon:yes gene_type:complete